MGTPDFAETLTRAADRCGVVVPPAVIAGCATHYALLVKWNATHNLTRVVDAEDAALKHYLDCAIPLLQASRGREGALEAGGAPPVAFADIGAGGGFPGLVAALVWPTAKATLVEPARKRQSFLQVAASAMGLKVSVVGPTVTPAGTSTLTAPLVLSRATFSAGERQTLWSYVAPGGALWAWTTPHELPTWFQESATWPGASATEWPYLLDGVDRRLLVVKRAISSG